MYNVHLTQEQADVLLMSKLPTWFKPVLEYQAIEKAHGVEVSKFSGDADSIQRNFFVQTADADTIRELERLMGISALPTDSLEYRRQRIMTLTQQTAPFTEWHLKERLSELFGNDYTLTVDPVTCAITILVTSSRYGAIELLDSLINAVVPAHLEVTSNQEIVRYSASNHYIAGALSSATIHEIPV